MKRKLFFLAALLLATVMNLQATVPAGSGYFTVTLSSTTPECALPDGDNADTVFIIGNFDEYPWQVKPGERSLDPDGETPNKWVFTGDPLSYPADFKFQFVIQYEHPGGSHTQVTVPGTPITFDGSTYDYQFTLCAPDPITYIAPVYNTASDPKSGILRWDTLSCTDYKVVEDASSQVTWNAGWYVVNGTNVTLTAGAVCNGKVHLILADGSALTAENPSGAGIQVTEGSSLTIYGQTNQSGQLIATGGYESAGIGGIEEGDGSNITINGGTVTATGGYNGAGIGGGEDGYGSNITINGGTVTATGGNEAAGIGGGEEGYGSNITINGGVITAIGGKNPQGDFGAAGIGGGEVGYGSNITINGGTVTATGNGGGAGIGGGYESAGSYITIHGGTVTATGEMGATGIGGGVDGAGSYITIHGGTVTATGSDGGAGIGGGNNYSGSNITIHGGTVTATGGENEEGCGAGIGNGYNSNTAASNIFVNPALILKADGNNPPTTEIAPTRTAATDIAGDLAGQRYATAEPMPEPDTLNYLHFVSLKDNGSVQLNKGSQAPACNFEYSKDNRKSWTAYTWTGTNGDTIALGLNDTIWFRAGGAQGKNNALASTNTLNESHFFVFGENDSIAAEGNTMSLLDDSLQLTYSNYFAFCYLFQNCKALVSAPELPSTAMGASCYYGMFQNCTSLMVAPALPAETLETASYCLMFDGCTSLIQAPELKATKLAIYCYYGMFQNCSKLQVDTCANAEACTGAELVAPSNGAILWNGDMFTGCHGAYANNIQLGGHYCIKEYVPSQIVVTYDLQGHGEAIKNDTILSGDKLTRPADPKAEGYEFRNWYTDAQSLSKAFDFDEAVIADKDTTITLYAKWREPAAWEQFKKDLNAHSYVEYDTAYDAGFMIHLATADDAQVQTLTDAPYIEASEEVLSHYDFTILTTTIMSLYAPVNDEVNKCMGEEAPIRRKPKQNTILNIIASYTQLPYRVNGLIAVGGLFSSYVDLMYKAWLETNYQNDAEICKCIFNSDVIFKASAKLREALDVCEK